MKIEWRPLALGDLADIVSHIAADSPKAAYEIHARIQALIERLAAHPRLGRPGRVRSTRELVVSHTPFLVAYRITGRTVTILRVLHGARRWPENF